VKAVISSTYDDKYLFFIPIVTWCWNKLGVDVICFAPNTDWNLRACLVFDTLVNNKMRYDYKQFESPEHKEATYAQCSRLYAACLNLPESEILITSDVDMALFQIPPYNGDITIFGSDLVPPKQYPMCYASATVKDWRSIMKLNYGGWDGDKAVNMLKTYQQCLDELLGHIETEHFRGNYWGKDQETLWENSCDVSKLIPRTNGHTPFATKRYDRDDAYLLDRLNPDTIDYHLPRPGYEENNFRQIMRVLKYHYPNDDFGWLENYREQYLKLL